MTVELGAAGLLHGTKCFWNAGDGTNKLSRNDRRHHHQKLSHHWSGIPVVLHSGDTSTARIFLI